jgi:hypothetical protein
MLTLAQLREAAGGPDGLTDEEIIDATHSAYARYYPSRDAYASAIGYAGAGRTKNAARGSAAVDNYQASMYGLVEAGAEKAGLPRIGDWARRGRETNQGAADYASQRASDLGAVDRFRDIRGPSDFGDYAAGLAIGTAPQMAAMATGAAAGAVVGGPVGAVVGGVAAGYPSNVGTILQEQRDQAGSTDLLSASALAVPYTAVDALTGIGGTVNRVIRGGLREASTGGLTKRIAKGTARGSAEEAAGEVAQTGLEQVGRMQVDPNETFINPRSVERFEEAAVGGATLGGIMGGAGGIRRRKPAQAPVNDAPGESTDILADPPGPPLGITYEGTRGVGQLHVFPDGSTATEADMQTLRDHGKLPEQLDAARRLASAPQPTGGGVTPQQQIETATGVGQRVTPPDYQQQAEAAFNEPTGQRVTTQPGQLETDQTAGDAFARQTNDADNQLAMKLEIEKAAQDFAERKALAHKMLVENDANGQPMIQLSHKDLVLHHDLVTALKAGVITQEKYTAFAGAMREALKTKDRKSITAVRKALEEIKTPKPAPVAKTQQMPTSTEASPQPVAAPPVAAVPAQVTAITPPAAAPPPKVTKPKAPKPAPAPVAPPKAPEPAPVAAPPAPAPAPTPVGYDAYEGRSVAVQVHVEGKDKPIRRVVKNAGAALKEADDRISKFEALAKCLRG